MEGMTYLENGRSFMNRDDYYISDAHHGASPDVSMRKGTNEGYYVTFIVFDEKTYNEKGKIIAKFLGPKEDALKFVNDLWNIT